MIEINPAELPVIWLFLSMITLILSEAYLLHRASSNHPVLEFYIALFVFFAGLTLAFLLPFILEKFGMIDVNETTNLTAIIFLSPL